MTFLNENELPDSMTEPAGDDLLLYAAFHGIAGRSHAMLSVFRKIQAYGPTDASVIITGETGSGKELVARAIHEESRRSRGPFVAVNCTAISEELLESELFGHERGSFTGALRSHKGRFERADGGTLFLDEIGDMPVRTQAKLLRVLEEKQIERVGAERPIRVNVRIVAATNVPLEREVGSGRFRADLYHRLSVLRIHVPPLRERGRDLELLSDMFLAEFREKYGRAISRLTPAALELLYRYAWPGNVRELRNVLERVFIETHADLIGARAFEEWVNERQNLVPGEWNVADLESRRASQSPIIVNGGGIPLLAAPDSGPITQKKLAEAFRVSGGNITGAARKLGVHKATLYRLMKREGITREALSAGR